MNAANSRKRKKACINARTPKVTVDIVLPAAAKGRKRVKIQCDIQPDTITVYFDGKLYLEGTLWRRIVVDDSTWVRSDGLLQIELMKEKRGGVGNYWEKVCTCIITLLRFAAFTLCFQKSKADSRALERKEKNMCGRKQKTQKK